jgi:hypothetical protein
LVEHTLGKGEVTGSIPVASSARVKGGRPRAALSRPAAAGHPSSSINPFASGTWIHGKGEI